MRIESLGITGDGYRIVFAQDPSWFTRIFLRRKPKFSEYRGNLDNWTHYPDKTKVGVFSPIKAILNRLVVQLEHDENE